MKILMGCNIKLLCEIEVICELLSKLSTFSQDKKILGNIHILKTKGPNTLEIDEESDLLIMNIDQNFMRDFDKNQWIIIQQILRFLSFLNIKYQGKYILLHASCSIKDDRAFLFSDYYNNTGKTTASVLLGIENTYLEDEFVILNRQNLELNSIGINESIHLRTDTITYLKNNYSDILDNIEQECFISPEKLKMMKVNQHILDHLVVPIRKSQNFCKYDNEVLIEHLCFSHLIKLLYRGYDRFDVFSEILNSDENFFKLIKNMVSEYPIDDVKEKIFAKIKITFLEYNSFDEMVQKVKRL